MKITFLLPVLTQNGGNRVVAIYARKLIEMGHDVTAVSRAPQKHGLRRRIMDRVRGKAPPDPNRDAYFRELGARHVELPFAEPPEPDDIPNADVIVATFWRTAYEVADLPPEKGAKVYLVQGHEVYHPLPRHLSGGSYYLPLKKIVVADWLVQVMANHYDDHDVVKVANSVDCDQFQAPPRTRNTPPRVGLVYSPLHLKGTDVSLKAIEIARRTIPDLQVLAFGGRMPTAALPLPQGSEFHHLPAQETLAGLYAKCDAWLFGSRTEGFGLPILESMACRTPVIAARSAAAPDLIEDGVTGHLVDIDDAEAMAACLVQTLTAPAHDWQAMSDAAHSRAHGYSWDDAAHFLETALQEIVDQNQL